MIIVRVTTSNLIIQILFTLPILTISIPFTSYISCNSKQNPSYCFQ